MTEPTHDKELSSAESKPQPAKKSAGPGKTLERLYKLAVVILATFITLAEAYIQYMIAQELKENSKWIISGESIPIVDLQGSSPGRDR